MWYMIPWKATKEVYDAITDDHWLGDYIIQQKYIEIKKIQWMFHFILIIMNDALNLFLRIKLLRRHF